MASATLNWDFRLRKTVLSVRMPSQFNDCKAKVFSDSQCYPYDILNRDTGHNQHTLLYEIYADFQVSCYKKKLKTWLAKGDFTGYTTFIIIDSSKQKCPSRPADVHLEFQFAIKFAAGA
jgi:hypothetical protein